MLEKKLENGEEGERKNIQIGLADEIHILYTYTHRETKSKKYENLYDTHQNTIKL